MWVVGLPMLPLSIFYSTAREKISGLHENVESPKIQNAPKKVRIVSPLFFFPGIFGTTINRGTSGKDFFLVKDTCDTLFFQCFVRCSRVQSQNLACLLACCGFSFFVCIYHLHNKHTAVPKLWTYRAPKKKLAGERRGMHRADGRGTPQHA